MFGALFCTLAVKFFHALRTGLLEEYLGWITADLVVLLGAELLLLLVCHRWPRKGVLRASLIIAAVLCTWSVFNAGWLIATGTQILPSVLASLVFDPINRLAIIGHHLLLRPLTALALLGPSAIALVFLFSVLAHPVIPPRNTRALKWKFVSYAIIVLAVSSIGPAIADGGSSALAHKGLTYNSQAKAVVSLFSRMAERPEATHRFPRCDEVEISLKPDAPSKRYNVVVVILEGIGYKHTSLYDPGSGRTPYLEALAAESALMTNARPPLTHSTKAFFTILTGRLPSITGDYVEALPVVKPYASLATILKDKLDYKTAFFQSAKGTFEARPGLVHNLGFEKFWTREYADNPDIYLGYLASDEFAMLEPIAQWIQSNDKPFFLTLVLSATHDPYEVPAWFGENTGEPLERYHRTIAYTDSFLRALDQQLKQLNCAQNTVFCIVGDHGEAFGEHQRFGHDLIPFDEVLRIVWLLRAPGLLQAPLRIDEPVTSTDVTPTILSLLGFDITRAGFEGIDILAPHEPRRVYFSGWVHGTAAGFVEGNMKYIYDPTSQLVVAYDLAADPDELYPQQITGPRAEQVVAEVTSWKDKTFVPVFEWGQTKEVYLFDHWRLYRLRSREPSAQYVPR